MNPSRTSSAFIFFMISTSACYRMALLLTLDLPVALQFYTFHEFYHQRLTLGTYKV